MRYRLAILFVAASSVWADEHPLTWERASIVQIEEVVASGCLAPTDPHPTLFEFFSDAILESDGSVIFVANSANRGKSVLGREGVYGIDRAGRPSTFVERGEVVGKDERTVAAVRALEMRDGVPVAQCLFEDNKVEEVVLGGVSSDREISATSPRSSVFGVRTGSRSVYRVGDDGTRLLVADHNTQIYDLFEGSFTGFDERVVSFGPWVVFSGYAKTYKGLFAMNLETNRLYVLLDSRASVGDRRVADFQISESPRSDADFAVTVSFRDGVSGIYIFRFGDQKGSPLFGGRN
jgi:hypothetical protein